MKVNELRVGNYIQAGGAIVRVDAIEYNEQGGYVIKMWPALPEKRIDVTVQLDDRFPDYAQPIPLTEELLLKCGFHKRNQYKCFSETTIFGVKADLYLFERDGGYLPTTDYPDDNFMCKDFTPIGDNIQYLHQLQNLYFALTGEELEVEL